MLSKEIRKEIIKMAAGMLLLCSVMVLIFYIVGHGGMPVILGALLGAFAAVLNYYLLALTVTKACEKGDGRFNGYLGLSYTARILLLGAIIIFAIKCKEINYVATVIPLVFPRILVTVFGIFQKKKAQKQVEQNSDPDEGLEV